jgi:hypothetical protein
MQYYSDYSKVYTQAICDALNQGGFTTPVYNEKFIPEKLLSLTDLLEGSVVYYSEVYNYLSQKGLVNTGRCPFTGETIDFSFPSYTFFDRKVYVSNKGFEIMKKESDEKFEKITGIPAPTRPASKSNSKGCYIATVCYGSANAPEVVSLKNFRDRFLNKYFLGRTFIKIYYLTSPRIASYLKNKPKTNSFIRKFFLNNIVRVIKKL